MNKHSSIIEKISSDLVSDSQARKKLRLEDEAWKQSHQGNLSGFSEEKNSEEELKLNKSKPRMTAQIVYLFLLIRGYLGSIKSKKAWTFIQESRTLHSFFSTQGISLPGKSTVIENLNAVSEETHQHIFDCQVVEYSGMDPEDFEWLTLD